MSQAQGTYRIPGRPQTIYRVMKSAENPYVMIDRRPIDNPLLSFKAKGILTYLMSRPDGWEVSIPDLIAHAKDGEDGVRAGMKELKDAGHVKYTCSREQGRITGWLIEVFEVPHREKPDVVLPDVVNPTQVLSTLSINELNKGVPPEISGLSLENQIFAGVDKVKLRDEVEERRLKMVDMANLIDFQAPGAGALAFAFMQTRGIIFTEKQVKAQRNKAKELLDAGVTPKHVIEATKAIMTARQKNGKTYTCADLFSIERTAISLSIPVPEDKPRMQTIGVT